MEMRRYRLIILVHYHSRHARLVRWALNAGTNMDKITSIGNLFYLGLLLGLPDGNIEQPLPSRTQQGKLGAQMTSKVGPGTPERSLRA